MHGTDIKCIVQLESVLDLCATECVNVEWGPKSGDVRVQRGMEFGSWEYNNRTVDCATIILHL